jgi:hypothetical protein
LGWWRIAAVRPPDPAVPASFRSQFVVRAVAIVAGLTMLLVVEVRGVAFYVAWALIVLAFLSEAAATLVYWHRIRARGRGRQS